MITVHTDTTRHYIPENSNINTNRRENHSCTLPEESTYIKKLCGHYETKSQDGSLYQP